MSEWRQARFTACKLSFARFERADLFAVVCDECQQHVMLSGIGIDVVPEP